MSNEWQGERLKRLLTDMGWSHGDMGAILRISKRTVARTIAGKLLAPPEVQAFWEACERLVAAWPEHGWERAWKVGETLWEKGSKNEGADEC